MMSEHDPYFDATGAISADVATALAAVVEALFHGIYTSLFTSALPVLLRKRAVDRCTKVTHWVFLLTTILMYIVSSSHTVLTAYRFVRGYIVTFDPNSSRWETFINVFLLCFITWLGDVLVIFRCYLVWNQNLWVIALPTMLLFATVGINATVMYWYNHPSDSHRKPVAFPGLVRTMYPFAFAQNFITTSLIAVKIWRQHRASAQLNVVEQGSNVSLIRVLRIVVESAMIYTIQIFLIVILNALNNNFQIIVQAAIVPSIGIVFVLIALRVHNAKSTANGLGTGSEVIPAWLHDEESSSTIA